MWSCRIKKGSCVTLPAVKRIVVDEPGGELPRIQARTTLMLYLLQVDLLVAIGIHAVRHQIQNHLRLEFHNRPIKSRNFASRQGPPPL